MLYQLSYLPVLYKNEAGRPRQLLAVRMVSIQNTRLPVYSIEGLTGIQRSAINSQINPIFG